MSQRAIAIKKRQYDALARLFGQRQQVESVIAAKCNTLLEGLDDEIADATILGVRQTKTGFELMLDVTAPAKAAKPLKARRVR